MDLASLPLFSAITRKMSWLTHRQSVLAENVANVDTPGYKASDLRPLDFRSELGGLARSSGGMGAPLQLASTDPKDITLAPGTSYGKLTDRESDTRELNGNTVSVEEQMMKVSETSADYQLMSNLYKKQVGMISTAIGKSG